MAWPDSETYSFADFRKARGDDWFSEGSPLARWLARHGVGAAEMMRIREVARAAATAGRVRADLVEQAHKWPRLKPSPRPSALDVELPPETRRALADAHATLWKPTVSDAARYASIYLMGQNGEAGVMCSIACTDGLARALRALGSTERDRAILRQIETATLDSWIHGAQFVTEIQGGSDAATNTVRAEPTSDGLWHLTGQKWFCSNLTAQYWVVTARPPGHDVKGPGLFVVPREWDGRPNGHVVERLKDKLGTRALPTAEVRFEDAKAWPLGPLEQGLRNMVAIVLTTSRVHNTLASAACIRHAAREARAYAHFRTAFGRRLEEHTLLADRVTALEKMADLTDAGAFATVDAWLEAQRQGAGDAERLWSRVLISLAKAITARRAPGLVYEAMMVLGGNGIEERFTPLPRLWRDAAILETWEGPYTLLLMQALEDLGRLGTGDRWRAAFRFGLGDSLGQELEAELAAILEDPQSADAVRRWGEFAPRLYAVFEARSLQNLAPTALAEPRPDRRRTSASSAR